MSSVSCVTKTDSQGKNVAIFKIFIIIFKGTTNIRQLDCNIYKWEKEKIWE